MTMLKLSNLPKTWIFDLDGTILKHNGYLSDEGDKVLKRSKCFIDRLPPSDFILILTARDETEKDSTLSFLKKNNIRYDHIIFNVPVGERILLNDVKPSGLKTSYAVNLVRDVGVDLDIITDL